ncbi:MAG TPA: hypothetical protein DEO86_15745 [Colwellia sp.]|nr:hypothetical protein [Colwellia sp.]|tara:strand:+ start:8189 stop:8899 length:711 start_codon:yes stop_codon:yes gene_type:complete
MISRMMNDMEIKLGSQESPILLVEHTSDKQGNDKSERVKPKQRKGIYWPRDKILNSPFDREFTAIKNGADVYEAFILNVMQNPFLSALEMKLALYFYYLEMDTCGQIYYGNTFLVDETYTKKQLKKLIGYNGTLYYKTDEIHFDDIDDFIKLIDDLEMHNIETTLFELKVAIQNLSDYAYITVTPIAWEFTHARSTRTAKGKLDKPALKEVYAQNIRIFPRMCDRLIFKKIKTNAK